MNIGSIMQSAHEDQSHVPTVFFTAHEQSVSAHYACFCGFPQTKKPQKALRLLHPLIFCETVLVFFTNLVSNYSGECNPQKKIIKKFIKNIEIYKHGRHMSINSNEAVPNLLKQLPFMSA